MSALIGHAKAARILGEELGLAANREGPELARLLFALSDVHKRAADRMERAMREEASGATVIHNNVEY